uniref:Tetraspanin n=1 Tax=Syphacia muris TaxID=451379 RepID=A0A0N5AU49_9BILA
LKCISTISVFLKNPWLPEINVTYKRWIFVVTNATSKGNLHPLDLLQIPLLSLLISKKTSKLFLSNRIHSCSLLTIPSAKWRYYVILVYLHFVVSTALMTIGVMCFVIGVLQSSMYTSVNCSNGANIWIPLLSLITSLIGLFAIRVQQLHWPAFLHFLSLWIITFMMLVTIVIMAAESVEWLRYKQNNDDKYRWANRFYWIDIILCITAVICVDQMCPTKKCLSNTFLPETVRFFNRQPTKKINWNLLVDTAEEVLVQELKYIYRAFGNMIMYLNDSRVIGINCHSKTVLLSRTQRLWALSKWIKTISGLTKAPSSCKFLTISSVLNCSPDEADIIALKACK